MKAIMDQCRLHMALHYDLGVYNGHHPAEVIIPPEMKEKVPFLKEAPSAVIPDKRLGQLGDNNRLRYRRSFGGSNRFFRQWHWTRWWRESVPSIARGDFRIWDSYPSYENERQDYQKPSLSFQRVRRNKVFLSLLSPFSLLLALDKILLKNAV